MASKLPSTRAPPSRTYRAQPQTHQQRFPPRAHYTRPSSKKPKTFPRSKKESQNTITQLNFLIPDSDEEAGEKDLLASGEEEWESPQPQKRRRKMTSSDRSLKNARSVSESQNTLTQMRWGLPGVLVDLSEDEDAEFHSANEDLSEAANPNAYEGLYEEDDASSEEKGNAAAIPLVRKPLGDITTDNLRVSRKVPCDKIITAEHVEDNPFLDARPLPAPTDHDQQTARPQDDPDVVEDISRVPFSIYEDQRGEAPGTPVPAARFEIPSSQSPALTPISLRRGSTQSRRKPRERMALDDISPRELLRRDENSANTPSKRKETSDEEDEENIAPKEPFVKETPTKKSKTSPLKNQIIQGSPFEPSQLISERRRLNVSPSPTPCRIHSVGSTHVRAMPSSASSFYGTADEEVDLDDVGEPSSPSRRNLSSGQTPATSFSPRFRNTPKQAQASPTARLLFKRPEQPSIQHRSSEPDMQSRSSQQVRRRQSDLLPESQASTVSCTQSSTTRPSAQHIFTRPAPISPGRTAQLTLDSIPPPSSGDFDLDGVQSGQLMTMSQLLAAEKDEESEL